MFLTIAILAGLVASAAMLYNRLVWDRNRVDAAWSDIDVQLQRRHDLIPQIVKAVDQYADYERATLEAITVLRAEGSKCAAVSTVISRPNMRTLSATSITCALRHWRCCETIASKVSILRIWAMAFARISVTQTDLLIRESTPTRFAMR